MSTDNGRGRDKGESFGGKEKTIGGIEGGEEGNEIRFKKGEVRCEEFKVKKVRRGGVKREKVEGERGEGGNDEGEKVKGGEVNREEVKGEDVKGERVKRDIRMGL